MKNVNDNFRRYPRTMQEAFGPYTSNNLIGLPEKTKRLDKFVFGGSVMVAVVLFVVRIVA